MRFVSVLHLKPNMVLAFPLFDAGLSVLLGKGIVLSETHIQRINKLGYAGVYIDDEETRDIVVEDIIPTDLRIQTIQAAREIMQQATQSGPDGRLNMNRDRQKRIIMPVIEALIARQKRFVDMIDVKPYDQYDYYHTANVVVLSILLGLEIGLSGNQIYDLGISALLHDIGIAFIPKSVINKPERLLPEEYELVKSHTDLGFSYLRNHLDLSIDACMGTLHHHENYDGSGYPNGLQRDRISIYGRIISIADVFDAMISRRPYRQPMYPDAAMEYLTLRSGTMFDPDLVRAFHRSVALYPSGCIVELNSGVQCFVLENYIENSARPRVQMKPEYSETTVILDLKNDPDLENVSVAKIVDM